MTTANSKAVLKALELGSSSIVLRELGLTLLRFPPALRVPLFRFASGSRPQRDLLDSFPAAAVIAVSEANSAVDRAKAISLLNTKGARLKDVATAFGLPMWMSRIPPEGLHHPLPEPIVGDGDTPFGRAIVSAMPETFLPADPWLHEILSARRWGGDDFAVWLARKFRTRRDTVAPLPLHVLAAWVFFSGNPEAFGARYVLTPWHPRMSLARAAAFAWGWLLGVIADVRVWSRRAPPCWAHSVVVDSLSFVPLETLSDLETEGALQDNCVARYVERVIRAHSRLYSVRHGDTRLATLEIKPGDGDDHAWIAQLKGPSNAPVPRFVADAATIWLREVQGAPSLSGSSDRRLTVCTALWEKIWSPYWTTFGATPRIEPDPSPVTIHLLLESMRACVQAASVGHRDQSDYFLEAP